MMRGLLGGSALVLAGACVASHVAITVAPHRAHGPVAPAAVAPAAAAAPLPHFVELHGGAGVYCARSDVGELWCWGVGVEVPGEARPVERARPTRIANVPALAGFTIATYRSIVGWDRSGTPIVIAHDPFYRGDQTIAVHRALPALPELPRVGQGQPAAVARDVKLVGGSGDCVVTDSHELWCAPNHWSGAYGAPAFARIATGIARSGAGPCAVDVDGHAVVYGSDYATHRLDALGTISSVACWYTDDTAGRGHYDACGVASDGDLRCTNDRDRSALAALLEGHRATAMLEPFRFLTCVARDDGQARCVPRSREPHFAPLAAALQGVDARDGVAAFHGSMCALGRDGVARCWGELGSPELGDGSTAALAAPVHLPAYDGADAISSEGGVTCVRTAPLELRCFGRIGSSRVEPARIPLPEEIDAMAGGFPACVRGAASQRWYCRDPFSTFFAGSLPGGWEPLRDTRGHDITTSVRSVAVDSGLGIVVVTTDGAQYDFAFTSVRRPLRFARVDGWPGVVARPDHRSAIAPDGGARIVDERRTTHAIPGPVTTIRHRCALLASGELWCVARTGGDAVRALDHVVDVTKLGAALLDTGEVRSPTDDHYQRVTGLPAMHAIGDSCGLSRDHEVWCWGHRSDTDEPIARLVAMPVAPQP